MLVLKCPPPLNDQNTEPPVCVISPLLQYGLNNQNQGFKLNWRCTFSKTILQPKQELNNLLYYSFHQKLCCYFQINFLLILNADEMLQIFFKYKNLCSQIWWRTAHCHTITGKKKSISENNLIGGHHISFHIMRGG